jgi:HK97 family phage prohead protease
VTGNRRPDNTGLVIQGIFFRYGQPFWQGDRWKVVMKGAFDASLKKDHVRAWLEHNPDLEIGCTQKNMLLESTDTRICFRLYLRDDEISRHARALVEARIFLDTSIGFSYAASDTFERTVSNTKLLFISKATLLEGSLVRAGACERTSVVLKNAKDCEPLFIESKTSKFVSDNAFTDVIRKIRNLESS